MSRVPVVLTSECFRWILDTRVVQVEFITACRRYVGTIIFIGIGIYVVSSINQVQGLLYVRR
jgi:hypothetical protein